MLRNWITVNGVCQRCTIEDLTHIAHSKKDLHLENRRCLFNSPVRKRRGQQKKREKTNRKRPVVIQSRLIKRWVFYAIRAAIVSIKIPTTPRSSTCRKQVGLWFFFLVRFTSTRGCRLSILTNCRLIDYDRFYLIFFFLCLKKSEFVSVVRRVLILFISYFEVNIFQIKCSHDRSWANHFADVWQFTGAWNCDKFKKNDVNKYGRSMFICFTCFKSLLFWLCVLGALPVQ